MNINKLFPRMPIRVKLTIAFALMSLAPLTIMGAYGLWITRESLETSAVAQVRHYVDLVKVDVGHLLERTRSDVNYLEQLDSFSGFVRRAAINEDAPPDQVLCRAIALFCESHPVYFQIRFLSPEGDELLRVVGQGGHYSPLPARREEGGARFYRHALEQATPPAFLSIPVELKDPVRFGKLVPAVSFVRPSFDDHGVTRGMWVADLYAEQLTDLLQRPPFVPGGELVLCDAQGHYLYHPARKKEWHQLLATGSTDNVYQEWGSQAARAILSGQDGVITGGGQDIVAYTAVWSDPSDVGRGYVLYYRIPAVVALAPARRFGWAFVLLGILTMALVVGAAYLGAGQLTRPLVALSKGARIIAGGDFGHRIEVASNDEIETLAGDFNRMADAMAQRDRLIFEHETKLRQYAEGLEGMVQARTAELQNSQRQLAQSEKMATVGKLAAGLAHEINNPAGIVLNRIEAMLEQDCEYPNEDFRNDLQVLARHIKRIGSITESLLRFSRPRDLNWTIVDLCNVCQSVVALIHPEFENRGVLLTMRRPADPVTIRGDQDRMEQVLLNLLDNALDASTLGGHVILELDHDGAAAAIRVKDLGSGIAPEDLGRIFDPFFSTKGAGQGSGLGLTITDELVRGHGGTIRVNSVVGEGTEFVVKIPLKR